MKKEDFKNYIIDLYDQYLMETEKRGISWSELAYIETLNKKELIALESEINYFECLDKSQEYYDLKYN